MECKVIWTDAAIVDLHGVCSYIAEDNPAAALRMGEGILTCIGGLTKFPYMGNSYPTGTKSNLREIGFRKQRIFYEVDEKRHAVSILHIWHGARAEPKF
jgi:plasmid stabilization system protein ParE